VYTHVPYLPSLTLTEKWVYETAGEKKMAEKKKTTCRVRGMETCL